MCISYICGHSAFAVQISHKGVDKLNEHLMSHVEELR